MLKRFRPYLRYLYPVRWHFTGALIAGLIFGIATGAGLPLLTEKILPRLLKGDGKELASKELQPEDRLTLQISAENKGSEVVTPAPLQVEVAAQAPEAVEIGPLEPGQKASVRVQVKSGFKDPVTGKVVLGLNPPSESAAVDPESGKTPLGELILLAMILPLAFIVRGIAGFLNSYGMTYCGQRVLEALRVDVFAHLQQLSLSFYQRRQSGDLVSRLVSDTTNVRSGIVTVSNDLIKQPITLLGAFSAIVFLSIRNSEFIFILVLILSVPLCIWPIHVAATKMKKRAKSVQKQVGGVAAYFTENLQAPREIRAFNLQEPQVEGLKVRINKLLRLQMKLVKYSKLVAPSVEVIASFGIAATVIYAGRAGLGLEKMLPLLLALYVCYEPVKRLGGLQTRIKRMEASLERIEELLHATSDVQDPENPEDLGVATGAVEFRNVTFAYDEEPVLKGVDLKVKPGEVIGIVGPSGAGKSTFINLLLRLYDVSSGAVMVDGHDVRHLLKHDLRNAIGFVPQDPVLFNATAKENILIGRADATDEEIIAAARQAQAHEFIEAMDEGYDTMLGEKATRLSGGQRQRLALARAFLKNAPILVLDEAASALDSENEALVQKALEILMKGKTVFIIAHRFSTLNIVNRILVINEGEVVGDGTNEELQKNCPLYRDLRQLQVFDA